MDLYVPFIAAAVYAAITVPVTRNKVRPQASLLASAMGFYGGVLATLVAFAFSLGAGWLLLALIGVAVNASWIALSVRQRLTIAT